MTPSVIAVVAYSVQIGCLIAVAAAAAMLLRLPSPAARLAYWRAVGALCVVLPLLPSAYSVAPSVSAVIGSISIVVAARGAGEPSGRLGELLIWTWAAGVCICAARLAAGAARLRALRIRSAPGAMPEDLSVLQSSIAPHADLRWSDEVRQPVTFGYRRPVVLLPAAWRSMNVDEQRAVVCHELLHVARRDWVWILLEEQVRAVFWFHPAIWWLVEQVQLSREQLIDQIVVARTGARRAYMNALLAFADVSPRRIAGLAFLRAGHLKSRLQQLSKEVHMSRIAVACTTAALLAILGGATAVIAGARPLRPAQAGAKAQDDRVTLPVPVVQVKPEYTPAALAARIEGEVLLEIVVQTDGTVGAVKIVKSLDKEYGLDEQAVSAARQWRFRPGTRDGKPQRVAVTLQMRFALK